MKAQVLRSAFGRALEDQEFASRLDLSADEIEFEEAGFGWFITARKLILCSGPEGSRALGVELFRRWTGKEVDNG